MLTAAGKAPRTVGADWFANTPQRRRCRLRRCAVQLENLLWGTLDSAAGLAGCLLSLMRRLSLALLLSFLLVFVQHGAVLHELGHLSHGGHDAGATLRVDLQPGNGGVCQSCEAYAQVANPAASASATLPLDPAAFIRIPDRGYAVAVADSPTPRSRGPPSA